MARRSDGLVLRQIRTLFNLGVIGELTDGQLVERFATAGGEAAELAFAALVERHGPMVLRICRNVLRDPNDVEDAFQATFLVLVERAPSLWVEDSLAPWIHRVARRIAVRARANAARRQECERRAAESRAATVSGVGDDDALMALLHEEIDRLPERCRVPVVLCDLEGLTHEQAARHLSWPIGTVKSRLMSGRERLRARLVRRGITPAIALAKMANSARSTSAAVPAGLVEATVQAARFVAAGAGATAAGAVPAAVALLMEGALNTMFVTRIKLVLLACGLIAGGAVVAAQQAGRNREATPRPAVAARSDGPEDEEAAVARDMARLVLDLLDDEVRALRDQVNAALQTKIGVEMQLSRRGPVTNPEDRKAAYLAYEVAREAYLTKARELASRRHGKVEEPRKAGHEVLGDMTPRDDRSKDREAAKPGTHASAATIGSIDLDAVFKRYAKVRRVHELLDAARNDASDRLADLENEAKTIVERMQRLAPGSADYVASEEKVVILRQRRESERDRSERDITRRQAREMATLFGEIQETITSVARAKGLDTVVKVSPGPQPDADPNTVHAALNRSVLYANPRNDITDEVIRELNRRFDASGDKAPR
jgi:RNA polymerase sigma factor (sigma-70 family)